MHCPRSRKSDQPGPVQGLQGLQVLGSILPFSLKAVALKGENVEPGRRGPVFELARRQVFSVVYFAALAGLFPELLHGGIDAVLCKHGADVNTVLGCKE